MTSPNGLLSEEIEAMFLVDGQFQTVHHFAGPHWNISWVNIHFWKISERVNVHLFSVVL
jgi:hypothetical protein